MKRKYLPNVLVLLLAVAMIYGFSFTGNSSFTIQSDSPFVKGLTLSGEREWEPTNNNIHTRSVLYSQIDSIAGGGSASQQFPDFTNRTIESADDFVVPGGEIWTIDSIDANGTWSNVATGTWTSLRVRIFADSANVGVVPGALIYEDLSPVGVTAPNNANITLKLSSPAVLNPGRYWVSVIVVMNFGGGNPGQWFWATRPTVGNPCRLRDSTNLFGAGLTNWSITTTAPNQALAFSLRGISTPIPMSPTINPIIYPQYIQGLNGTNNGRIPYVFLAQLNNLSPSSTYRYYNLAVTPNEASTVNGAGIIMFADPTNFRYAATGNFTNTDNYGEFTTDGSGSYTGWFVTVPSGNARFTPGNHVQVQVLTNDGMGGTAIANRIRAVDSVKVVNWGTTSAAPNEGSFFYGQSTNGTPKNFVVMYDNVGGTGRPITGGFIEAVGYDLNLQTAILPAYRTNVAAQSGRWGVLIPNALPNGIRRIEERALLNVMEAPGDLVQFITEASGNWNGIANTVDPNNGADATLVYNGPLPVDLISFNAATDRNNVMLSWETAWEENNDRFEVQRRISANENSSWTTVGTVRGAGTTYEQHSYSFTDKNLSSGIYEYRLVQFDLNGNSSSDHELSGTVSIGTPDRFELTQNYPNPFNPVTKIDFQLPLEGMITLRVFDMTGREVTTVMNEFRTAGYHSVQFDGSSLASGMYVYQLTAGSFTQTKKMLMIK